MVVVSVVVRSDHDGLFGVFPVPGVEPAPPVHDFQARMASQEVPEEGLGPALRAGVLGQGVQAAPG